jgi:hypothetical protein
MGGFKKKTDLFCTATYVITKAEHSRELTELMCSVVYPRGMTTTDAPGQMAFQFVPDVTLPMNSASKTMKAVHFQMVAEHLLVSRPNKYRTETTDMIIDLDAQVPGRSFTLRTFIIFLHHESCSRKNLFTQIDHWITDPSKVVFTFHEDDKDLAFETIYALPLILKAQGIRDYGDLFIAGTKKEMKKRYVRDENGLFVSKIQKRFQELQQTMEDDEAYNEEKAGILEALLESQNTNYSDDQDQNIIFGMELLWQDSAAANRMDEASIGSNSTLNTLQPLQETVQSNATPPHKNTMASKESLSSASSGSTLFSKQSMATLQPNSPTPSQPRDSQSDSDGEVDCYITAQLSYNSPKERHKTQTN